MNHIEHLEAFAVPRFWWAIETLCLRNGANICVLHLFHICFNHAFIEGVALFCLQAASMRQPPPVWVLKSHGSLTANAPQHVSDTGGLRLECLPVRACCQMTLLSFSRFFLHDDFVRGFHVVLVEPFRRKDLLAALSFERFARHSPCTIPAGFNPTA